MSMLKVIENKKPKTFRSWIAMKLVRLAQRIEPDSEAVKAFTLQMMIEQMIYGQSIVRVDPEEVIIYDREGVRGKKEKFN